MGECSIGLILLLLRPTISLQSPYSSGAATLIPAGIPATPHHSYSQQGHHHRERKVSLALFASSPDSLNRVLETSKITKKAQKKRRKTQLRQDLQRFRLEQAQDKPPYTIFTNTALEGIYKAKPTTRESLLAVKGIGPKKIERYGDAILALVAPYIDDATQSSIRQVTPVSPGRRYHVDQALLQLTEEQRRAALLPLNNPHMSVFLTGAAGTGKSFVLQYILHQLKLRGQQRHGVCAPTGVAAVQVGGSTLHSYFGIGLGQGSFSQLLRKVQANKDVVKRIHETDILCIDECSMMSADLFETIDAVAREVRMGGTNADRPFGGMQIIAVGDFYQLPPVYRPDATDPSWRPYCFESPVWSELGLTNNTIELTEVQRQGDQYKFVQFLNMVRNGTVTAEILHEFNDKCLVSKKHPLPDDGIVPTRLHVLNRDVDAENQARLAELQSEEVVCKATSEWRENLSPETPTSVERAMYASIDKEMPEEIRLKIGAQVMLTRNKDLDRNLVNGSRGIIEGFARDSLGDPVPIVRFDGGLVLKVPKAESLRYNPDGGSGCLVRKQIPLKLAWAMTVHKSQGSTLTRALLDISSAFESGQAYVALSRVRRLEGLWLERPARMRSILVNSQVKEFYARIGGGSPGSTE